MHFPEPISPQIGEKCHIRTEKSSPIPDGKKCILCMRAVLNKAFASLEEDQKKKYLCTHECFKKYFAVPSFTLDPAVKKSRRKLKFAVSTMPIAGSSAAKYEIRDLTPRKSNEGEK
jgi:hypothetical protein